MEDFEEKRPLVDESSHSNYRKAMRRRAVGRVALRVVLLLGIEAAGLKPFAQFPSNNNGRFGQQLPDPSGQYGQESNSPEKRRIQMLNAQRQKSLVSDAEKLLKLAKQLNDEVSENESSGLSSDQLHKVEEIGKLARSVKSKMSFTVGGYPSLNAPLTTQPGIE
jgi:hypothetical protein